MTWLKLIGVVSIAVGTVKAFRGGLWVHLYRLSKRRGMSAERFEAAGGAFDTSTQMSNPEMMEAARHGFWGLVWVMLGSVILAIANFLESSEWSCY